jgi:cyclin B
MTQVGVTGMLIASKYEEIWAPEVRDFVYISDKAYTREQIISMEKLMLNTLGFSLTLPTPYNFLARFLKAASTHLDKQVREVCMCTCLCVLDWCSECC